MKKILARLRTAHPDHHTIAKSMGWIMIFVFVGKIAGAAKEMAVSYRYGVGAEVDAYLYVYNLVAWPVGVWFSVLTAVLVPLAARIQHNAPAEMPLFRAELLGFTLLLGLLLTLVGLPALQYLLNSSLTGLSAETTKMALDILPALMLLLPIGMVISLFSAWLLAAGRHVNTLLEGVPALAIAAAVLLLSTGGVEILAYATLAGFCFHLFGLAVPLLTTANVELPRFRRQSLQWPLFWQGFGVMLVGQALMSFIGIIDQFFAAHLGTGAIATISYANRILALILGLGATAISRATLPVFSKAQAQGSEHIQQVAKHWVRLLFSLGVIALVFGWWLAPWMVKLLFERGAFSVKDTLVVTEVFRYGLLQLPFYFTGILFVSLLTSQARYGALTIIGALNLIIKISANLTLIKWMGINGVMLATALMLMVSTMLSGLALYFGFKQRQEK
ncbi:MAG: lipid II flippase MurJ [Methylococcaceae bacterium]|nr:lipid II flippase MurJ [Methylococcaceae bacterium]MDP3904957.1 lipid II flippase MurJ [Methylococcaceae bacterium]